MSEQGNNPVDQGNNSAGQGIKSARRELPIYGFAAL